MVEFHASAAALLARRLPRTPVILVDPAALRRQAHNVTTCFPGEVRYAVKCNDLPPVLEALHAGGVRAFDVASIHEVRLLRSLFGSGVGLHFMHPVKPEDAIAEAWHDWGVRHFAFDHEAELDKILRATGGGSDLLLSLRVAVDGAAAALPLAGKFGCEPAEAVALLQRARRCGARVGLTFHVGSQCLDPSAFVRAIGRCAEIAAAAGGIDELDVGGGFPAPYTGGEPPFATFVAAIREACESGRLDVSLACEPGRLLVAEGVSVLARVELRRDRRLYLNDGVYGNLAELRWLGPCFPMRIVVPHRPGPCVGFELCGPTCDSVDVMPGPHLLPEDVDAGDWIEIGAMGAYSCALHTRFNGFGASEVILLERPADLARADDPPAPGAAAA